MPTWHADVTTYAIYKDSKMIARLYLDLYARGKKRGGMCMCVCMHVCVCGCVSVCMYAYVYVCLHVCVYACICVCVYMYVCV